MLEENSFYLRNVNKEEITSVINTVNPKKVTLSNIQTKMIKQFCEICADLLN